MINTVPIFEMEGTIVERYDTKHHSDRFRSRDIVLEANTEVDGQTQVEYFKMRLIQERCDLADDLRKGYRIIATIKVSGRKFKTADTGETVYFTNLEAINITLLDDANNYEHTSPPVQQSELPEMPEQRHDEDVDDDLPF